MSATIQAVLEKYPQDVRFVFKNFPLPFHPHARAASELFLSAMALGKGWELHDWMFKNQAGLTQEGILKAAAELGLDTALLNQDLSSKRWAAMVDRQIGEGEAVNVEGTPTLFINGRPTEGRSLNELMPLIDEEMAEAKALRDKGISDIYAARIAKGKVQKAFEDVVNTFDLTDAPSMGTGDGSLSLVLFSDFQCPFCARFGQPLEELLKKYPGQAKLYFKHFPLEMHEHAKTAALAGVAAHKTGKFWKLHDLMFANFKELSTEKILDLAQQAGLDRSALEAELKADATIAAVEEDLEEGRKAGVRGTPTLFINGRKYSGAARTADGMAREIDKNLLGR